MMYKDSMEPCNKSADESCIQAIINEATIWVDAWRSKVFMHIIYELSKVFMHII